MLREVGWIQDRGWRVESDFPLMLIDAYSIRNGPDPSYSWHTFTDFCPDTTHIFVTLLDGLWTNRSIYLVLLIFILSWFIVIYHRHDYLCSWYAGRFIWSDLNSWSVLVSKSFRSQVWTQKRRIDSSADYFLMWKKWNKSWGIPAGGRVKVWYVLH